MSKTVPPSRRHSSGARRRARADPVRWSHQAVRADSTCARGKGAREVFNLVAILYFYLLAIQFSYSSGSRNKPESSFVSVG